MTPASAKNMLARMLDKHGSDGVLTRKPSTTLNIRCFIYNAAPDELVADVQQADRVIVTGVDELEASSLSEKVIRQGDSLKVNGKTYTVRAADGIAVGGQIVRYNLKVRG